jgi:hypothetical protein
MKEFIERVKKFFTEKIEKPYINFVDKHFRRLVLRFFVKHLTKVYQRFLIGLQRLEDYGIKHQIKEKEFNLIGRDKLDFLNSRVLIVRNIFGSENDKPDNVGDNSHVEQQDRD